MIESWSGRVIAHAPRSHRNDDATLVKEIVGHAATSVSILDDLLGVVRLNVALEVGPASERPDAATAQTEYARPADAGIGHLAVATVAV